MVRNYFHFQGRVANLSHYGIFCENFRCFPWNLSQTDSKTKVSSEIVSCWFYNIMSHIKIILFRTAIKLCKSFSLNINLFSEYDSSLEVRRIMLSLLNS